MKTRKIILMLILAFIAVVLCIVYVAKSNKNISDLSEMSSSIEAYTIKFKSERGFGNDRFDIYSFSLKSQDNLKDFKQKNDELDQIFDDNFGTMMITEQEKNNEMQELKTDIEKLKNSKHILYKYIEKDGTKKLYLYDKNANIGYCMILTI
ncbi:MAG: hypothetical protein E7K75_01310 [Finegoldia magna]|uniref:Uncharacterized protein n=1 Tax=Finegoldia magna ATCC 53516 TaxID=525282 RepID=D6S9N4_FINMA|nr:hypothetical protein [Finegoldia magna]EFH93512.1 hypothetical protein HMPREF0391_11170 [Finegoldia magna ATCC 53516]MDU7501182.1 hypothetical protein [Finegoldia magna]